VFAKSSKGLFPVIPAEAGIQEKQALLDPGFRRGDSLDDFLQIHQQMTIQMTKTEPLDPASVSKIRTF
jgi:hypothetical protein